MTDSNPPAQTAKPDILGFKRLRIACPNRTEAVDQYRTLLGIDPVWQGRVELPERSSSCLAAWFSLENTTLELLELPVDSPSLVGIVFAVQHDSESATGYGPLPEEDCRGLWLSLEPDDEFPASMEPNFDQETYVNADSFTPDNISRVDHLVIYTHSADDTIRLFGSDGLGIRLALDKNVPEWGGRMLFFRVGKLTLEVIEPTKPFEGTDYFWGIAYQADDINIVHQRLSKAGVKLSDLRKGRKEGSLVASVKSHQLGIPTLLIQPR
ncbi:hypothetical protein KOI40_08295 [Aestuariicella sp. G3-2]|uniref:VOC family protein n=1 Tax=Pseudomaricurvus albidus TaxID=2842452 RepID=UPI001C0BB185|nr:VOC family protein [Aestuariicella albida]MBU3069818.1 hypothetical protein [Aestuariicella albida]